MAERANGNRYNKRYEDRKKKSSSSSSSESEHYTIPVYKPEPEQKNLKNHFKLRTGVYCINPTLSYTPTNENLKSTLATQLGHIDITQHDTSKSYFMYTVPSFGTSHNPGVPVPNNGKSSIRIVCLNHLGQINNSATQGKEVNSGKFQDLLNFRAVATSLAINPKTSSTQVLDLAIGFQSGEILLHDPLEKNKTESKQFNRGSQLASGSVTKIRWVPGERHIFAVSFTSGIILFMDRTLTPIHPLTAPTTPPQGTPLKTQSSIPPYSCLKQTKPGANPVKAWNISKSAIKDFCFSPDGRYLVAACQDGYLRFFHYGKDSLLVLAKSYYGGFQCVDWSSDGRIVIAGGEDDLVTLWEWDWSSFKCKCRARGESHRSWVSSLSFDRTYNGYRFGSVGEDGRLNLWEYNDNLDEPGDRIGLKPRGDSLWGRPTLAKLGSDLSLTTTPITLTPVVVPSATDGINNKTNGHSVTVEYNNVNSSENNGTTVSDDVTTPTVSNGVTVGTNGNNNNNNNTPKTTKNNNNGSSNIQKNLTIPQKGGGLGLPKNGHSVGGGGVTENNNNSTEITPSVMVLSVPPPHLLPDMIPLVTHQAHHSPCSGIAFLSSRDILTSAWGGDVKFWQFCKE